MLEEVITASSTGAREDEKPGGKNGRLKKWFQRIAGDIRGVFDHVINLTHWKVEHLRTPNRDDGALQALNWVKPKLISSKQLDWKFYFYDFWWKKWLNRVAQEAHHLIWAEAPHRRWVALLIDDDWKRVYKQRVIEDEEPWESEFMELDKDLREKLLKAEDINEDSIKFLRTNWRVAFDKEN